MTDLGTLGGNSSAATGINASGQIVGYTYPASGAGHAFLYEAGIITDLNSLLPANSGWDLQEATAINDSGQIVGYGTIDGQTHAFLLNTSGLNQSIMFGPLGNLILGSGPFALSATASSGLPVSFASTTPAVCAVSGTTVTIIAGGTCSIAGSQPGNSVYAAATPVTQTFTVSTPRPHPSSPD